jgi:hypothetical protein
MLLKYFIYSKPHSVLDVGLVCGKMGFLDRLFTGLMDKRHRNKVMKIIDGIAPFSDQTNASQKDIYNNIYAGDAFEIISALGTYDMVILEGVLENFSRKQALEFLDTCISHSNGYLIVCVSLSEKQGRQEEYESPHKKPISFWRYEDFKPFVHTKKFLQYTEDCYGIFLVSKEDYIDRKIAGLLVPSENNIPGVDLRLRKKYALDRGNVLDIDFSKFSKYVSNLEHRDFFFDGNFVEHYRLLAYLSTLFSNANVFDIGTSWGYSAVALSYNRANRVISYDIVDCKDLSYAEELSNIEFRIGDVLQDQRLLESPLIILDTDHDGIFEQRLYLFLKENDYKGLLLLDDMHLNAPMIDFWSSISDSKEDITDLGHWAGTGLVEFL